MQSFFLPVSQFDLVEPRILSGVVTQGRGGGTEEWVETFIVRYSPDGKTWTTLMEEDGSNKVSGGETVGTGKFQRMRHGSKGHER